MSLQARYARALTEGNLGEAKRLERLMERLDDQRRTYGKGQRG